MFTKKLKNFAHKRQIEYTSTVMVEPSIPFQILVEHVDPAGFTKQKNRTFALPLLNQ